MISPQDIREKTFEKAVFGGYDVGAVDSFLEEVAGELAAAQKESAVLKSKLKVLVEKVEEYRSTEDAMRMALLSAQKMSADITEEAKEKSDAVLAQARQDAETILNSIKNEVAAEEQRLVEAKRNSAQFLDKMRLICTKQLDFFDALGEMQLASDDHPVPQGEADGYYEKPETELESTVRSIETSVASMVDSPDPEINIAPGFENVPEHPATGDYAQYPDPGEQTRLYSFGRDLANEDKTPRPKFAFNDLRFGENYENH